MNQAIVSRDQWLDARKALLAKERAMTHHSTNSAPSAGIPSGRNHRLAHQMAEG